MKKLILLALIPIALFSFVQPNDEEKDQSLTIQMAIKNTVALDKVEEGPFEKNILVNTRDDNFHILLTNHSKENIAIWKEWCSWGYFNLTFEVLDENDKVVYVIKKNERRSWTENFPDPRVIKPGETLVREVNFNQSTWVLPKKDDLPEGSYTYSPEEYRKSRAQMTLKIRAVFEIYEEEEEEHEINIWTGKIKSAPEKVNFIYPWNPKMQYPTE